MTILSHEKSASPVDQDAIKSHGMGDAVKQAVANLPDQAATAGRHVLKMGREACGQTSDQISTFTKNKPFIALIVAVGIGVCIGIKISRSRAAEK